MPQNKQLARVKQPAGSYDPAQQTFSFVLGNVSAHDAAFIGEVVAFFTDPLNVGVMDHIKHGRMAIQYRAGRAELVPVFGRN